MKALVVCALPLALAACGSVHTTPPSTATSAQPMCLTSGRVAVDESFSDYGSVYEPGMNGPAPATPPHVARTPDSPCAPPP